MDCKKPNITIKNLFVIIILLFLALSACKASSVWNMEQNDPDPFMRELNKQGLPYVVLEIDSKGDSKVLEDGRK